MILPIYVADRSILRLKQLQYSLVDVSLAPIPDRSVELPNDRQCVWSHGQRPMFGIITPAGTQVNTRLCYDPNRSTKHQPHAEPDYPTAIVRYGEREYDAATLLTAAIDGRNAFKIVDNHGEPPECGDSRHMLDRQTAATRTELAENLGIHDKIQRYEKSKQPTPALNRLKITIYSAWETCRHGPHLIWRAQRLSFEPIPQSVETADGDPEIVYVEEDSATFEILGPGGATYVPGHGIVTNTSLPENGPMDAYIVVELALGKLGGFHGVAGLETYKRREAGRINRGDPRYTTPTDEPLPEGHYTDTTIKQSKNSQTRKPLSGQLSLF